MPILKKISKTYCLGIILLVTACNEKPDLDYLIPPQIETQSLVYWKYKPFVCRTNVFKLRESFVKEISKKGKVTENLDAISQDYIYEYEKWQYMTLKKWNLPESSSAGLTLKNMYECLQDNKDILRNYERAKYKDLLFTSEQNRVLVLDLNNKLLFVSLR